MKIKNLGLLPEHYPGGPYSGMDYIGIVSWNEWALAEIDGDKLILKVEEGRKGAGQKSEIRFRKDKYDKLTDEEKKKIDDIFKGNIGNTIKMILELDFA